MIGRWRHGAVALAAAALLAGCGSSVGLTSASGGGAKATGGSGSLASMSMSSGVSGSGKGSSEGASSSGASSTTDSSSSTTDSSNTQAAGSSSMAGMNMGTGSSNSTGTSAQANPPAVNGIKPVASQALATAYWQGMEIQARTMTPTTFVVFTSTGHEQTFKANPHMSFHLMIMLNDRHTNVPIPYASVWATILSSSGKVVFDQRQWPMISAYMGPHYGNNVTLPGPGRYTLKLLISPPVAARHMEYAHVWQSQHEVVAHFTWKPTR